MEVWNSLEDMQSTQDIKRNQTRNKEMNELVLSHDFRSAQIDLTSAPSYITLH
jgi:hypothetical protein